MPKYSDGISAKAVCILYDGMVVDHLTSGGKAG